MKYFLHLAYKGTRYRGWQRQAVVMSVQQAIEEAIMKILKTKLFIVGCGRTDAGVHASNYIAHVKLVEPLPNDFHFVVNKVLPPDIVIHEIIPVADESQAQFHVLNRRYDYYFHTVSDPILNEMSTLINIGQLDMKLMKDAVHTLLGEHDFSGFCKHPEKYENTVCNIKSATIVKEGDRYQVRLVGNRFLRSMVRLIVSNLLMVGEHKLALENWTSVLDNNSKFDNYRPARPEGLYLSGVYYPSRSYDKESFISLVRP